MWMIPFSFFRIWVNFMGEPGHPYHFLYIEFVVGVSGFRRNQRGKIPEIIPAASTGSGETWVLTIHPILAGAGS